MLQFEPKEYKVLIAIQARSTSTRFPNKIFELLGSETVLQTVVRQANKSAKYCQTFVKQVKLFCNVAILHPENDMGIINGFKHMNLVAGDEHDVLSRYVKAADSMKADYIVRITADCPLILDFIISKHITVATINELDYVSNVEETCRTVADGLDCEILSRRALDWLNEKAITPEDREHVTLALRRRKPNSFRYGFVSSKLDTSSQKLSLDTKEDLVKIRKAFHEREYKLAEAKRIFGPDKVYEI
jgi:spore coat polysaccharide biosynthesis protein SpsF